MRVLFTLLPAGGLAHLIPLIALQKMLPSSSESAFLVPQFRHKFLRQYGLDVLDIDHQDLFNNGFRTEMLAYGKFKPDVVIDDSSFTTGITIQMSKAARVAIQRTGMFPGGKPRNDQHVHSMGELDMKEVPDVTFMGLKQPGCFTDLFEAEAKIVPGLKPVELLPETLRDPDSYFFSGPLIIEDYLAQEKGVTFMQVSKENQHIASLTSFDPVREFFDANSERNIVYTTLGTIAVNDTPEPVTEAIKRLLDDDVAVVSSINVPNLTDSQASRFYFASYLPMHFVCSNVDLVVHHCGSGTYHYPIIHEVPTITVGTGCYDREDVAVRLEELGVSEHLTEPNRPDFVERFTAAVARVFDDPESLGRRKQNLAALNEELRNTQASFNLEQVLGSAIDRKRPAKKREARAQNRPQDRERLVSHKRSPQ